MSSSRHASRCFAAVLIAIVLTTASCSSGGTASSSDTDVPELSVLFSVVSTSPDITSDESGFRVSIPADSRVAWFSDRPERRSGVMAVTDLVAIWGAQGFNSDPPNAALVVTSDNVTRQHVVELTDPQVTETAEVLHAVHLDKTAGATVAGRFHTDEVRPGSYTSSELFIDDATYLPCPTSATSFLTPCLLPSVAVSFVHPKAAIISFCSDSSDIRAGNVKVEWSGSPIIPEVVPCPPDSAWQFPANTAQTAQLIEGPAGAIVSQTQPTGPVISIAA